MAAAIHVGVSGFSYPAWKGRFYPKDLKNEDLLVSYAGRLDSVEINSSFYGAPRGDTIKNWGGKTGNDFRFAFKAPRLITHIMKLGEGSVGAATRFSGSLEALGPKCGPILFQLPPFLKRDLELLEKFLEGTESIAGRVFEFRNSSWIDDSTYRALRENETGFCIAETEDMGPQFEVTSGVAYFRLRRDAYDIHAIDSWASRIKPIAKKAEETYIYLRHDETGENAVLAERLAQKLSQ